ncbi:MAG: PQQ-dependent sugar dehydrogenase [Pseudomonadota bacterium]
MLSHSVFMRLNGRYAAAIAGALLLGGCGGGGGDGTVTAPPPAAANPTLSIADASLTEGDTGSTVITLTVSASAPAGTTVSNASVDYATAPGTATAIDDYIEASGTLNIPGGTTSVTIDVEILGDSDNEGDETFTVTLSNPQSATLGQAVATVTIRDDDVVASMSGLDARPTNLTCVAPARPTTDSSVAVIDAYPGLPDILLPTKIVLEPGGARWFVTQKTGEIVTFPATNPSSLTEYLDLNATRSIRTNSEGGLLGLAFHPDYPTTPELFVSYTIDHTGPAMRSVVSRLIIDDPSADAPSVNEQVIITVDQDFDNHNGGDIAFGPDGFLYIGLGDGGSGNDPLARSQDNTRLLGAMLRLDVSGTGAGYTIPADNPFAGNALCGPSANAGNCPEIFAWGLRNPWRWAFDTANGSLWLADVGQGAREEVNLIERGGNYGWRCKEGTLDTINAADCDLDTLLDPVTEYGRNLGNSITGGQVYRGDEIPSLIGHYVYGDFGSGRIWAARPDGNGGFENDELVDSNFNPTAFANDADGEIVFVNIGGGGFGRVQRLTATSNPGMDTIPDELSDTGCVQTNAVTAPADGLIPYTLNAAFWSDGAVKDRHIALPEGSTVGISPAGDFEFPEGTILVKNFRLGGRLIETRHLIRHPDGVWAGYTYEWNATETAATRVRGGKTISVNGQQWIYPSEAECMQCHTSAAGFSLGAEVAQINRNFTYPQTGRTANQLSTLSAIGVFDSALSADPDTLDQLADPDDASQPIDARARAWLHTNCAQCHRANGPTPSAIDLRYDIALPATNTCDVEPVIGDLGIADARLIAPGDASRSLVVERMSRRDVHGMPPVGSARVDTVGITLVSAWIDGLANCN